MAQTARQKFETKLKTKQEEAKGLELKLTEVRAYIQALEDMLKHLPQEDEQEEVKRRIRPGSLVHKALLALQEAMSPLHITKLLEHIGLEANDSNRRSLTGSLGGYVRAGQVFDRPEPNTFGLIEWGKIIKTDNGGHVSDEIDLPDEFGSISPGD